MRVLCSRPRPAVVDDPCLFSIMLAGHGPGYRVDGSCERWTLVVMVSRFEDRWSRPSSCMVFLITSASPLELKSQLVALKGVVDSCRRSLLSRIACQLTAARTLFQTAAHMALKRDSTAKASERCEGIPEHQREEYSRPNDILRQLPSGVCGRRAMHSSSPRQRAL